VFKCTYLCRQAVTSGTGTQVGNARQVNSISSLAPRTACSRRDAPDLGFGEVRRSTNSDSACTAGVEGLGYEVVRLHARDALRDL
jgi:hypothetical protein